MIDKVFETDAPEDLRTEQSDERQLTTADVADSSKRALPVAHASGAAADGSSPLFLPNQAQEFRASWEKIQIAFVDEPRKSVEQADDLVSAVIKRLEEIFAEERTKLELEWDKNDKASTEDLRVALR